MSIYQNRYFNYPNLRDDEHEALSPSTSDYNCVAWVAGETDRWWEPSTDPTESYWPPEIPREDTLAAYLSLFASLGFGLCADNRVEPGFEKIAIYADSEQMFTHVARQEESGLWTSKMGDWEDIEHVTLDGIAGRMCGAVLQHLRRRRPTGAN